MHTITITILQRRPYQAIYHTIYVLYTIPYTTHLEIQYIPYHRVYLMPTNTHIINIDYFFHRSHWTEQEDTAIHSGESTRTPFGSHHSSSSTPTSSPSFPYTPLTMETCLMYFIHQTRYGVIWNRNQLWRLIKSEYSFWSIWSQKQTLCVHTGWYILF